MTSQHKLELELNHVQILFEHKQIDLCFNKINKIIKQYKKEFLPYNYRGVIYLSLSKNTEALEDFKKSIILNPNFAEGFNNLALTYRSLGLSDKAVNAYKKSIELNPHAIETRMNLVILLRESYQYLEAVKVLSSVLEKNPKYEYAHQLLADTYLHLFRYDLALDHHVRAGEINPSNFMNYFLLGTDYLWAGDREKSSVNFKKAIELNPNYGQSYYGLSRAESINLNSALSNQALKLIDDHNFPKEEKVYLLFFIAKIYENTSDAKLFFHYLNLGCQLQKEINQYNFESTLKLQSKIERLYEDHFLYFKEYLGKSSKFSCNKMPIFIIGMPRSGTSLIEQIISNHSNVFGAGELNIIHSEMQKIFLKDFNRHEFARYFLDLGNTYLKHLNIISEKHFVTDKLPLNFHWLGFIKLLFPNAKFVHIKRNPIATSFSIYKTLFAQGVLNFSYSFSDIINYYKLYESTINFWSKYLPNDMIHIDYDELVKNPPYYVDQLCKFINLPYEDHLTNLSLNNRPVHTASDLQIRSEIYTGSSNSWKKYEDYLQAFIKALS